MATIYNTFTKRTLSGVYWNSAARCWAKGMKKYLPQNGWQKKTSFRRTPYRGSYRSRSRYIRTRRY